MDKIPLKVLLLEGHESDSASLIDWIGRSGFDLNYHLVNTRQSLLEALGSDGGWDIIISDSELSDLSLTELPSLLLGQGDDTPLLFVTDSIGEKLAVELMRGGACDVIFKDELSRLGTAITTALQTARTNVVSRSYQQRLQQLVIYQENNHEKERVSIARDIHDELGGMLTAIKLDVRWLHKRCAASDVGAEEKFSLLGEHLDGAINSVRRIITELRPSVLDDLGLVAALEWQLNEFERRHGLECIFDNLAADITPLDKCQEVTLFRIFQESLTNIAKHAKATKLVVRLTADNNRLHLEIIDNGIGISENNKQDNEHYGILGMNERARSIGASLELVAIDSGGTRVSLSLPL